MDFTIIINWMSPLSFLGMLGVIFIFQFFDEIPLSKQNSPRWDAAFYSVCLCPIKGMPGLNELMAAFLFLFCFSLGAHHDGYNNECSGYDQYIMTARGGISKEATRNNPWKFSSCSIDYFRRFIQRL